MRYLGVDPGGKRLGLAVGDDRTGIVTPLEVMVYTSRQAAARAIAEHMGRHDAGCVVIGLPTTAEGGETPACARSHALAEALRGVGVDVCFQPEHLTTDEARRRARETGRPRRQPVDDLAAQVILEEYLAGRGGDAVGST